MTCAAIHSQTAADTLVLIMARIGEPSDPQFSTMLKLYHVPWHSLSCVRNQPAASDGHTAHDTHRMVLIGYN
jgi:hypothetical protein